MSYVWSLTLLIGVALQVLIIATLLRGGWRRFKVLFVYLVVLLLGTVVEAAAFYQPALSARQSRYYWTIDAVRQGLILLLVISLIYTVLGPGEKRAAVRRLLGVGAGLFVVASLYFTRDPRIGHWMTELGRNLGFLAVLLNLILWAALIQSRARDRTVLMVSGGLGIQMAGKAIGHSLRQLLYPTYVVGDLIIVLSHLMCLYIWWQALRSFPPAGQPATDSLTGA